MNIYEPHDVYKNMADILSSSEDEMLLAYAYYRSRSSEGRKRRNKKERRVWVHETLQLRSQLDEFHRLVQELKLDSARFQQYFRMTQTLFES